MAVEDAVVLGSLFSHLRMMDQIPSFLDAYQELRQRRCDLVKLADIGNAQMVSMPDGEPNEYEAGDWPVESGEGTLRMRCLYGVCTGKLYPPCAPLSPPL